MTKPLSNNLPKPDIYRAGQTPYVDSTNNRPAANETNAPAPANQYPAQNDAFQYEAQMRRFRLTQNWAHRNATLVNNQVIDGGSGSHLAKTLTFTPQELGAFPKKGKLPARIETDESHFEQKLFNSYGLDELNPQDRAILQNVFQKENPGDGIDWSVNDKLVNKLTAVLNSEGQYEVKFSLDKNSDRKLNQALFNKLLFPNQPLDSNLLNLLGTNAASGNFQQTAENPDLTELALDLTQMGLDVVGIFEPTPFADLTNTGISAVRGNWGDAALSVLGVAPYIGDFAKIAKIPKWLKAIERISSAIDKFKDVAKYGGKGAEAVKEFVKKAKAVIDSLPIDKLPDALRDAVKSVKQKIDDFVAQMKKADNSADNVKNADSIKNADEIGDVSKQADKAKTTDTAPAKQPDVEPPQKPNDVDKQKKIEELKAKRAEAEAQKKLQEGIKDAEANGKLQKIKDKNVDDYNWLESNPRNKELAYDPDTKSFKVEEGRAALKAEQDGLLKPPVKRAIDESGRSRGGDYIDGNGKYWDVKDAKLKDVDDLVEKLNQGENILIDARSVSAADLNVLESAIKAKLPANTKGELKILK